MNDDLRNMGRGPFSLEHARAEGMSRRDLRRLVRTNHLTRLRACVYVSTAELDVAAADPALQHAIHVRGLQLGFSTPVVAAAASAARIYGLEFMDPPGSDPVVLTGDLSVSGTRRDGYRLRAAHLPDSHVTTHHGVRLTTPARTVVDLCAELPFVEGVVLADSALRRRLVTPEELQDMAAWPSFRRGIRKVREVIDFLDPQSESPLESASRATMHLLGIRRPRTQVWIDINGIRIRVDFFWDDILVIGEADGFTKYAARPGQDAIAAIRAEKEREQLALEAGYEMVRWGWREVRSPALLQRRLEAAFLRGSERQRGRTI